MPLAVFDFIPPLPSLWAIVLVAMSGFLWTRGRHGLALIPGGLGALFLFGWIMSLLSWMVATALTLAVIAAVAGGAYWLLKSRRKDKDVVDATTTEAGGELAPPTSNLTDDIDVLLRQMERERAAVRRR